MSAPTFIAGEVLTASKLNQLSNMFPVQTADISSGAITSSKLYQQSQLNTVDTWVPVFNNEQINHRIIQPFTASGYVPSTALDGESMWVLLGTTTLTSAATAIDVAIPSEYRRWSLRAEANFQSTDVTSSPWWNLTTLDSSSTIQTYQAEILRSVSGTSSTQATSSAQFVAGGTLTDYRSYTLTMTSIRASAATFYRSWVGHGAAFAKVEMFSATGTYNLEVATVRLRSSVSLEVGSTLKVYGMRG